MQKLSFPFPYPQSQPPRTIARSDTSFSCIFAAVLPRGLINSESRWICPVHSWPLCASVIRRERLDSFLKKTNRPITSCSVCAMLWGSQRQSAQEKDRLTCQTMWWRYVERCTYTKSRGVQERAFRNIADISGANVQRIVLMK